MLKMKQTGVGYYRMRVKRVTSLATVGAIGEDTKIFKGLPARLAEWLVTRQACLLG